MEGIRLLVDIQVQSSYVYVEILLSSDVYRFAIDELFYAEVCVSYIDKQAYHNIIVTTKRRTNVSIHVFLHSTKASFSVLFTQMLRAKIGVQEFIETAARSRPKIL